MYLSYEQIAVSNSVLTNSDLTVPGRATHAELLADTAGIRYTMDDSTDPTTTSGMILKVADEPKSFLIEDIRRIRFIRDGGSDAVLNVHYAGGRDV